MTHQQVGKNITIYIFILGLLTSINNSYLNEFNFLSISDIQISGLEDEKNLNLSNSIRNLNLTNILFLENYKIREIINSENLVENFEVFKKYPSTLYIKISKTEFLARINEYGKNFILGSNGKLIEDNNDASLLPFIFGKPTLDEVLKVKRIFDESKFKYQNIKSLYFFPSKRWDIEINNGPSIKLPHENVKEVLDLIHKIIPNEKLSNIKLIDARIKNQIILNEY